MANITGSSGNDVITGTDQDDFIDGIAGNDRINGGAGGDTLIGGTGADTLTGDAGNDALYGGAGNDGFFGGGGNDDIYGEDGTDTLFGDGGDDRLYGGAGNDTLHGGSGNDQLHGDTGTNIINGGAGTDTVYISLSSGDITSAVLDDFTLWSNVMEDRLASAGGSYAVLASQATSSAVNLTTIGLTLSGVEFLSIRVDGVLTSLDDLFAFGNQAPATDATVSTATNEDTAVSGSIAAIDPNGDALTWTTLEGPASGSLELNALTGEYTYTPGSNFSGTDSFRVSIEDPLGASVVQTVTVSVAAVNDAPVSAATSALSTNEDNSVSGSVTAADADGDALAWSLAQGPQSGAVTLNAATGEYTYTPAANFSGDDAFDVLVADPSGATSLQRVGVTVSAVADIPTLSVVNPVIVPAGVVLAGLTTSETLTGSAGSDTINGNAGNDVLDGNGATAITIGIDIASALGDQDGSETLSVNVGNLPDGATLSAGTQNEDGSWSLTAAQLPGLTVSATVTGGFTLSVTATSSEANGSEANGSEATATASIDVILSPDANFMSGGAGNDTMTGGTGNDTMYGNSGNDTMSGGTGNDLIYGGKNNDVLSGGEGDDRLDGNSGDDTFYGDAGNDAIIGGSGFDTLDYSNVQSAINVDLSKKAVTGVATGVDTISGIEKIIGSAFDNNFKGSKNADQMDGGAGNDWLRGLGGADILKGGAGSDTFFWEKSDIGAKLGVDHITDFGAGDVLDFKKLVGVGTKPLSDFVKVTDGAAGSTISAKINGTFIDVAVLENVHGTSASDLLANGHLLVG